MRTRTFISATITASLVLGLGACSAQTENPSEEAVTLQLLTFLTPNFDEEFWETVVDSAASTIPNLEVEILYSPDPDRISYTKQLASTGQLPDIVWDVVPELAAAGDLLPYPEEAFSSFVTTPPLVAGDFYGIPAGAQVIPFVYYNKSLFEQAGISEVPGTWDELVATAQTLEDSGITPFLAGGATDTWTSSILLDGILSIDLLGDNRSWVEELKNGEVAWTDPEVASAIDKWVSIVESGWLNDDALSLNYTQLQESFLAGEAAMYPMGSWASAITSEDFEIGAFLLPGETGTDVVPTALGNALAVSADSEHPELAQQFALALTANDDFAGTFLNRDSLFPTLEGYQVPSDTPPLISETLGFYSAAETTVDTLNWNSNDTGLTSSFTEAFRTAAQKVLLGELDAAGLAAELQAAWESSQER